LAPFCCERVKWRGLRRLESVARQAARSLNNIAIARVPALISLASIVTDRLRGSIPITTRSRVAICCFFDPIQWDGSRGHRCYEQSNPFLSHSDPAVPGTTQAK
jgi:hypothetical protein